MMTSKKILAVVDVTSDEQQAGVDRAAWLAERSGASVELFACDYDADIDAGRVARVWATETGAREHLLERHRRKLEELAAPLRERRIPVTVQVAWDYPLAEAIVKHAAAEPTWLVVKDTRREGLMQRTLLTSTDWHLVRDCPVPLLLAKPHEVAPKPVVLAAVDPLHPHDQPAALDDEIFTFAARLAESAHGSLHLVHVASTPYGMPLAYDAAEVITAAHRMTMTKFAEKRSVPADHVHVLDGGIPHERLEHAARDLGADFLVMGAIARRGLGKIFIGSTAARLLDRVPCDLVIVKQRKLVLPH